MRFAGQRFRSQSGSIGKYREGRAQAQDGSNSYANPTGTGAMTNMNEVNAASFTKTGQPDMSNSPFNFPGIQEPEFRHTSRI